MSVALDCFVARWAPRNDCMVGGALAFTPDLRSSRPRLYAAAGESCCVRFFAKICRRMSSARSMCLSIS